MPLQALPIPWSLTDTGALRIAGPSGTFEIADDRLSWNTQSGRGEVPAGRLTSLTIELPRLIQATDAANSMILDKIVFIRSRHSDIPH
jgi:hypothetical protein